MPNKTYVEIYNVVDFIKQNHSKLFPSEILDRVNVSPQMLRKIASDLNLELLTISRADEIIKRFDRPKRKYTKKQKKKSFLFRIKKLFGV